MTGLLDFNFTNSEKLEICVSNITFFTNVVFLQA